MSRLEAEVKTRGMTIFARIDHAAGATAAGLSLPPTEVLIFGNAKGGTPLMQSVQTIGIDLPLKALVWQEASGATFLSHGDPAWLCETARLERRDAGRGRQHVGSSSGGGESGNDVARLAWRRNRHHFIWPSNLAAPLPLEDKRLSASRPPAA
jgi:hypothetical protein